MKLETRSYCPSCKAFLLGGEHFDGRRCGTCHGETLAAWWETDSTPGNAVLCIQPRGQIHSVILGVKFAGEWRCRCPPDPHFDTSINPAYVKACSRCGSMRPVVVPTGNRSAK